MAQAQAGGDMANVPITLTCADYARLMPLATGEVKPEGIDLRMVLGRRGSWPIRAEMLRRAVQDPEVQGGEWSMAQYLYRIDKGDLRYVGLPVFPLRNFPARDLYVRRGGPIRRPADLAGKRIGMYSYTELLGEDKFTELRQPPSGRLTTVSDRRNVFGDTPPA
jgi:4,5-dihydroxyphthalate decarboxylase